MKILLADRVYDVLKWLCMIVLPALSVCYAGLAKIWGWPYSTEVAHTITTICVLIGSIIGVSSAARKAEKNEENH